MIEKSNHKKQILKHLGKGCYGYAFSFSLMTSSALALVDPADLTGHVLGAEGVEKTAKGALNTALTAAQK